MTLEQFIARWTASGAAERANKDSFLNELCDVLGVERPHPKTGDPTLDLYVFEKNILQAKSIGTTTTFVDLYKRGCFLLEAKQGATDGPKRRDSPAWNQMMSEAHGQALGYASSLTAPPPFLVVCDIGYCFDVYASFDGNGIYRPFPDGLRKRILLKDLATKGEHVELLRGIWTDPHMLDPSQRAARVTRDVAAQIAALARALESAGHDPQVVATFLMRCLFTMFAEDVGLLPDHLFSHALETYWLPAPESFPGGVASLWRAMDTGSDYVTGKLLHFNGGLFSTHTAPPLTTEQLILLLMAAKSDWSEVDPSIFGTLLERALNPKERHRLGAHYTPRAYVERLVKPTIEEPLRGDWDLVRAEVRELVAAGKIEAAQERVLEFHHKLCRTRVLDPACGTGNFLYVTLDVFKRIESEVLTLLSELGYKQIALEMESYRVTPEQFLGIEVKRWAKEIAELVLWIGYLQWQVRQAGGALTVPQPVLRDYGNIECRDAVLAYDREELLLDDTGKPVTRWDGETMKRSPVTGEDIPEDQARAPVYRYVTPRRAVWPEADFIVGNPPYAGARTIRNLHGDEYVDALRAAYPDIPETVDYVVFWWDRAAEAVGLGKARAFGLITTNSIVQGYSRPVLGKHLGPSGRVALVFAIPDHPWPDDADSAAVRVAMTVGVSRAAYRGHAVLGRAIELGGEQECSVAESRVSAVNPSLGAGVDPRIATALNANSRLCYQGVVPAGDGFKLERADELGVAPGVVVPYLIGRDIVQRTQPHYIIDLFGRSEEDVRTRHPAIYQHLLNRVKPERMQNKRTAYRERWWLFAEPRPALRKALDGLTRFIVTPYTSRHRVFSFVDTGTVPDAMAYAIASEDALLLGVLSSRAHTLWADRAGGRLGVGNDFRYTSDLTFLPYPFPVVSDEQARRIRSLGEALDAHRKRQQQAHPKLTVTGMYNVLEKLNSSEPLDEKDHEIHAQGLVSVLKQIHDDLDAAVFDAYGWPPTVTDQEILERLVALNRERAEEEDHGLIRWLRPEFQNPQGERVTTQSTLVEVGLEVKAAKTKKGKKPAWPKDLPSRVVAARDLLAERGEATLLDFSERFRGIKATEAEKVLESLAAVGIAVQSGEASDRRVWRLLR